MDKPTNKPTNLNSNLKSSMKNISEIKTYKDNPRNNDAAVEVVAKSIKEYGFYVPIILDKNNVIIAGHTRLKAAIKLGMTQVPVIYADNLNEKQINAFRIMENKSSEYASWDIDLLQDELIQLKACLDITGFRKDIIDILDVLKTKPEIDLMPNIDLKGELIMPHKVIIIELKNNTHALKIRKILNTKKKAITSNHFLKAIGEL